MVFHGYVAVALEKLLGALPTAVEPVGIVRRVAFSQVVGYLRPVEFAVAVVGPGLDSVTDVGEMKFSGQAAVVSGVGQDLRDEGRGSAPPIDFVGSVVDRTGIQARQEGCSAWCADRRLAEGIVERHARVDQVIQVGRSDVGIAKGVDGVPALLIRTDPEDVGFFG